MSTESKDYQRGYKAGRRSLLKEFNDLPSIGDVVDRFNKYCEEELE